MASPLVGLANWPLSMTQADLTRERGNVDVVRVQFFHDDWGTSPTMDDVDAYAQAGVPLIVTPMNDFIATQADVDSYVQLCLAVIDRWPHLVALEVQNEINYHYTGTEYLAQISAVYPALKAVQPGLTVLHSNVDHSDFAVSDQYFSAGTWRYCDGVGVHLYKFLGPWDADSSARGGVAPLSSALGAWKAAFAARYAPLVGPGESGLTFWSTEGGISVRNDDAVPAAAVLGPGSVPPGTYYYLVAPRDAQYVLGPLVSPQSATAPLTIGTPSAVRLTWPATITDQIVSWDLWRLASSDPRDSWQSYSGSGAPFDYRVAGGQYGYLGNVPNTGAPNVYVDDAAGANLPWPGTDPPPGFSIAWMADQLPRIVSQCRLAGLSGICWYTGRSNYANPDRGTFDGDAYDGGRTVQYDGTLTPAWPAFVAARGGAPNGPPGPAPAGPNWPLIGVGALTLAWVGVAALHERGG